MQPVAQTLDERFLMGISCRRRSAIAWRVRRWPSRARCRRPWPAAAGRSWCTGALGGQAAVPFEVELAFEGVVDRFDPLPDRSRWTPWRGASSRRSGRTRCSSDSPVTRSSNSRPGTDPDQCQARWQARRGQRRRQQFGASNLASADLRIGQAPRHRHLPSGMADPGTASSPQYQRDCACAVAVVRCWTRPASLRRTVSRDASRHGTGVASISRTGSYQHGDWRAR